MQPHQPEQTMIRHRFNQIEIMHRTGNRDIKGIDVKLVNLQRLIAFIFDAGIAEFIDQQIFTTNTLSNSAKTCRFGRDAISARR